MNKIKSKLNNWEAYKNLRKNIQPSFVIVAIIFIIGVGSIAYFIPKGAGSAGPDPATPLDSSSAQRIKDAIAAGATSYKLLIYDNRPQELADAIVAGNGNISITLRGTGSLSGTDYANLVSQAFDIVQANTGKLANYVRPNKFFASCCSNEPEFNEPVDPIKEAGNYSEFIDQLRKNNDLDKFSQGWYVADVANSNYITYLTQFLEYAGKDALEADFVPINCYQNCISRFDGLVQIYSAIFANPQLYIYETAPWQDQGLTYDGLKDFVTKCSSSNNCIDVLLFNALKSNGEFNWHWNNVTPEQIADLYASGKFSFNNQGLSRTFRGYIQYLLTGDQIFLKDYEAFVKLFETNSKYYQTLYTGSNELYGISSASTNVSCANGTLTFDYAVNRSNKLTTVADVSLGISYVITNKDKSTSSGYLGGSSRYGGNLNRPGADDGTTGSIITLSQGDNDGINHSVSYGTNAVSIKIIADLGFNSQYGFNHHLNECTIDLTECSSSSAKVVCNGANPNSLYCSPHDDSIKNAPLKQPTDA
ncbi:hypothetical protein KC660_04835, partial [Candidatus Dojkabacteria bacterium]|nr:hypothetical protein [Candidatus Dojkabacteria bacterium]